MRATGFSSPQLASHARTAAVMAAEIATEKLKLSSRYRNLIDTRIGLAALGIANVRFQNTVAEDNIRERWTE